MSTYFDYAAATPLDDRVLAAMQPYFKVAFYNPRAIYLSAQHVKKDLAEARAVVAKEIGAKPTEIIFTAGGTEANNMAIIGVASQYANAHVLTSAIEHDSVLEPAAMFAHTVIPVTKTGRIIFEEIASLITDQTVLVSCMLVNNEIGTIQDIVKLVALVNDIRHIRKQSGNDTPLLVHTDACQAVNYMDISVARMGVDLLTLNAGKIYGPKQCGVLYVKTGTILAPIIRGGGQERNLRSGTENVANCIGFAKALQITAKNRRGETERITTMRDHLIHQLQADANISINGPKGTKRVANNIHVTVDGYDNERLLMELDIRGQMVATGSACSASSDLPSHVLRAIGLSDKQSQSSIRITLGRLTTQQDVEALAKNILELVAKK